MRPALFPRKKKNMHGSKTKINPHSFKFQTQSSALQIKNQDLSLMMSYATLGENEIRLQKDISAINSALAKHYRGMDYLNGYLFLGEVKLELAKAIKNASDRELQIVTSGFKFKKISHFPGRSEEIDNSLSIGKTKSHSLEKSIEFPTIKLQKISLQTPKNLQRLPQKWEYFSKGRTLQYYKARIYERVGTELSHKQQRSLKKLRSLADQSFLQNSDDRYRYHSSHRYAENSSPKSNNRRYVLSELQKRQRQSPSRQELLSFMPFNQQQIYQFLLKQFKIVSVWLPPMNSPELIGFVSIVRREKKDGTFRCNLKKYYFLKKAMSQRLFNCLLEQLSSKGLYIDELSLVCTKQQLGQIFQAYGWKIEHWIGPQRVRIQYRRKIL